MTHQEGEQGVKALQKQYLDWVETHLYLRELDPQVLNGIRRKAFSSTFEAFRLGRVGLKATNNAAPLWKKFFAWASVVGLPREVEHELQAMSFSISLAAFRLGALVTGASGANELHD